MHSYGLVVSLLAATWLLPVSAGARAPDKDQEKDKSAKDKTRNEQAVEQKEHGTGSTHGKTVKYQPRGLTSQDMLEWSDGNPPGWSRGNKTGWGNAGAPPGQMKKHPEQGMIRVYPRGSEDWDSRRKDEWNRQMDGSKARILEKVRARREMTREDEESAGISFEWAARDGVTPKHLETTMNRAIARGVRGRDIESMTRAMAYGADKNTDYVALDRFIEKKMNEGQTGDELALSIYQEIDERHAAAKQEPAKKSWWKRFLGG